MPGKGAPVVLIIPGSGPTDRDGNNPMGVDCSAIPAARRGARRKRRIERAHRQARACSEARPRLADPNAVTIADYAADATNGSPRCASAPARKCVWLLGHSEGALVALAAAQQPKGFAA